MTNKYEGEQSAPVAGKPQPYDCVHRFALGEPRVCWRCGWDFRNGDAPEPPSAPVGAAEDMVLDAIERRGSSAPVGVEVGDKDCLTTRARELLADEYRKRGIGTDLVNDAGTATSVALAAIATALAQQPAAVDELVLAARELRQRQRDYLSDPKDSRDENKGRLVGMAAERLDAALEAFVTKPGDSDNGR